MAPVLGSRAASGVVRHGTHTTPLVSTTDATQVLPSSVDFDMSRRAPATGFPGTGGALVGGVGFHAGALGAEDAALHVLAGPGGSGSGSWAGPAAPPAGGRSLVKAYRVPFLSATMAGASHPFTRVRRKAPCITSTGGLKLRPPLVETATTLRSDTSETGRKAPWRRKPAYTRLGSVGWTARRV